MKTLTLLIILLTITVMGCARNSDVPENSIPNVTSDVNQILEPQQEQIIDSPKAEAQPEEVSPQAPVITTIDCPKETHTSEISVSGGNKRNGYAFTDNNITYGFSNQGDGKLYIFLTKGKLQDIVAEIALPTGKYAPKDAVKIDEFYAIKVLDRVYERIDTTEAKEGIVFEIYNLSGDCAPPKFETKPIMTLGCIEPSVGDCIGSKYTPYAISITARNDKNYSKFELGLYIDNGEKILPMEESENIANRIISQGYNLPYGIFSQGEHKLTVRLDTDDTTFSEDYTLLVLPEDKVALRKYARTNVCDDQNVGDFIQYYNDDENNNMIIKQNYYSNTSTIPTNGCAMSQTGFSICGTNEEYKGIFDYKIVRLENAKSVCITAPLMFPDNCKRTEVVQIGNSFTDNYGDVYELVKIYTKPKLVAFQQERHKWMVYYPYDKNVISTDPIAIQSVGADSVTLLHTDMFCDIQR